MPASLSREFLPDDFQFGEVVTTTLNGDYLYIDPKAEDQLVNFLLRRGYAVRRDDELINLLGRWL